MKPRKSLAMMAAERTPFPFLEHRTLAEVDETERLEQLYRLNKLKPYEAIRLKELWQKRANAGGGKE